MKRYLTILLLVIVAFSCKKDTVLFPFKTGGIILLQGASTSMQGTHKLVDVNGATMFVLESKKIDLDNYINQNVVLKGKVTKGMNGGPDLITVTKIN